MSDEPSVRDYYERNTRRFLRYGGGASSGAIHRQLWGDGVRTVAQASNHINELLAAEIRSRMTEQVTDSPVAVFDMGCGVGGTAIFLARSMPECDVVGITLSPSQSDIAQRAADRAGVAARCRFEVGDFETARLGFAAQFAIAIEAFVHARNPGAFFESAAAHLASGGRLYLIDDFPNAPEHENPRAQSLARQFRSGWRAPSFMPVAACAEFARGAGLALTGNRDLTGLVRVTRPRDRLIAAIAPLCAALGLESKPLFGNLIGGNALARGIAGGSFSYRWLEFRTA